MASNVKLLGLFFVLLAILPLTLSASVSAHPRSRPTLNPLEAREQELWRGPVHDAEFANVPHPTARARCETAQEPEALATPDPVLDRSGADIRIRVSFIVGTDGRVHSPLILESGDGIGLESVLTTVRSWRYRPGTCNGVPTETEGRIEFSSR